MNDRLPLCPFCGCEAVERDLACEGLGRPVECSGCTARCDDREDWRRRGGRTPEQAKVARQRLASRAFLLALGLRDIDGITVEQADDLREAALRIATRRDVP